MTINRRAFIGGAAGASALTLGGLRPAGAQAFPDARRLGHRALQRRRRLRHLGAAAGARLRADPRQDGDGREPRRRRRLDRLGLARAVEARRLHHRLHQCAEHIRRLPRQAVGRRPQGEPRELHAADQSRHRLQHVVGEARQPLQVREGRDRGGEEEARHHHAERRRLRHRRPRRGARHRRQQQHDVPDGPLQGYAGRQDPGAGRQHRRLCLQRQRRRGGREGRRGPSRSA